MSSVDNTFDSAISVLVESVSSLPAKDPKEILVELMLQFIGLVETTGSHLKGPQKLRIVQGALFEVIDKFPHVFDTFGQKDFVHETIPVLVSTSITVAKNKNFLRKNEWCCTK